MVKKIIALLFTLFHIATGFLFRQDVIDNLIAFMENNEYNPILLVTLLANIVMLPWLFEGKKAIGLGKRKKEDWAKDKPLRKLKTLPINIEEIKKKQAYNFDLSSSGNDRLLSDDEQSKKVVDVGELELDLKTELDHKSEPIEDKKTDDLGSLMDELLNVDQDLTDN